MQLLFLATAFAGLSALIPLSGVNEPNSLPLGAVLNRLRLFSKVRLIDLRVMLGRRKHRSASCLRHALWYVQ